MSPEELKGLEPGDIISSHYTNTHYIVTANYGDRVTAVKTVDVTNPLEWEIILKVKDRSK